jgi:hypothetical protein
MAAPVVLANHLRVDVSPWHHPRALDYLDLPPVESKLQCLLSNATPSGTRWHHQDPKDLRRKEEVASLSDALPIASRIRLPS